MSAIRTAGLERWRDPAWRASALVGAALLGALALSLGGRGSGARVAALAIAAGTLPAIAAVLGPGAARALRGDAGRALLLAIPCVLVTLLLLAVTGLRVRGAVALLAVALFAALGGLVLLGTDLRQRTRGAGDRANRSPWQQLTASGRVGGLPWRSLVGGLLVAWAAFVALGLVRSHLAGAGILSIAFVLAVAFGAFVLVGMPLLVGAAARGDRDRLAQARDDERQRVAAHLHDSVLQTLSLVQRQASDPVAVARLARHQERALRAWMAGRPEERADTLAGALHRIVEEVEAEESIDVEITVLGDRALDRGGDALVAAAREALRNAARHAGGAAVVVFAELQPREAAVYVRDAGPGFELDVVAPERRGVRDAIVGRMAGVGGSATIDSSRDGTEVALRLPPAGGEAR